MAYFQGGLGATIFGILAVAAVVSAAHVWQVRLRAGRRGRVDQLLHLAEEILTAGSLEEIAFRMQKQGCTAAGASALRLHLYSHASPVRRTVVAAPDASRMVPQPVAAAVDACYANRALLAIPDFAKSPFAAQAPAPDMPGALLLAPMLSGGQVSGVLECSFPNRVQRFDTERYLAIKHLANLCAIAHRLLGQRRLQEQLFRSEGLATATEIVAQAALDLEGPVRELAATASLLAELPASSRFTPAAAREVARQVGQLESAVESLKRLAGSVGTRQTMDLNEVIRSHVERRREGWSKQGLVVTLRLCESPIPVEAPRLHLDQTLVFLLSQAERNAILSKSSGFLIVTRGERAEARLEVHIPARRPCSSTGQPSTLEEELICGFSFWRSVIKGMGGTLALRSSRQEGDCLRLSLPLRVPDVQEAISGQQPAGCVPTPRSLTVLVCDPDPATTRTLVRLLGERSHRAIPVKDMAEAIDMVSHIAFDVIFCSVQPSTPAWVELYNKTRTSGCSFVFLAGLHPGASNEALSDSDGHVLSKPVSSDALDRLLASLTRSQRAQAATSHL